MRMKCYTSPLDATDLSPNQLAAIAALVNGASVTDAAKRAGVDRTTLHRWRSGDSRFVAELNRAKQEALDAVRGEMRNALADAAKVVRELITSADTPPSIRLRASLALLESAGALAPESIGPTTVEAVETRWTEEKKTDAFLRMIGSP